MQRLTKKYAAKMDKKRFAAPPRVTKTVISTAHYML